MADMKMLFVVALSLLDTAAAHASMIIPPSRNAVDSDPGTPWSNGKHPGTGYAQPVPHEP